jgi:hypothetical protein
MTPVDFLGEFRRLGGRVVLTGEPEALRLKRDAPFGVMMAERVRYFGRHRKELVALLLAECGGLRQGRLFPVAQDSSSFAATTER